MSKCALGKTPNCVLVHPPKHPPHPQYRRIHELRQNWHCIRKAFLDRSAYTCIALCSVGHEHANPQFLTVSVPASELSFFDLSYPVRQNGSPPHSVHSKKLKNMTNELHLQFAPPPTVCKTSIGLRWASGAFSPCFRWPFAGTNTGLLRAAQLQP